MGLAEQVFGKSDIRTCKSIRIMALIHERLGMTILLLLLSLCYYITTIIIHIIIIIILLLLLLLLL